MLRYGPASQAVFTVRLDSPSAFPVTVDFTTANGTALAGSDYTAASGTLTFAPGETTRTILVQTLDDAAGEPTETFTVNLSNPVGATIADGQGVGTILDNDATKFFVVNDGSPDRTYEYGAAGNAVENYTLNSGNTAPRGAASTAAGDKVWVVDANKKVYVYNTSGGLLGSWTAGSLAAQRPGRGHRHQRHRRLDRRRQAGQGLPVHRRRQPPLRQPERRQQLQPQQRQHQPQGHRHRRHVTSGSSTTRPPTRCSSTRSPARCSAAGRSTGGGGSPTGITLDPTSASGTCGSSTTAPTASTSTTTPRAAPPARSRASASFALAAGNTNPQGIADPPAAPGVGRAADPAGGGDGPDHGRLVPGGRVRPRAVVVDHPVRRPR